jgi:predicted negative regulator of RcsB-dependent stress response
MAFDLEEQEQLDRIKAFWAKWGNKITALMFVGLIAVSAWKFYEYRQTSKQEKAVQAFEAYERAAQAKAAGTPAMLAELQQKFPESRLSAQASFIGATIAIEAQDWAQALTQLQWIVTHGTPENKGIAGLEIADIQAQTGKLDDALKTLDTPPAPQFTAVYLSKKADLYMMHKQPEKAHEAMQAALKWLNEQPSKDDAVINMLQRKMELFQP